MASSVLPKPGTKYGPCKVACQHRDCAATRNMATKVCRICGKPIGYNTPFYSDPDAPNESKELVHAICLEDE